MENLGISLFVVTVFTVTSFALIPPLGDFSCRADSCDGVVCSQVNCTYGKLMSSPDSPCSCCKICLNYIGENELCGPNLSDRECGPGLYCTKGSGTDNNYRCLKMQTACFKAQDLYDEKRKDGTLGMYESRPVCDDNGYFFAKKCVPGGSCYCVDQSGSRIFGESPPNNASIMDCTCARDHEMAVTSELTRTVQFPHCLPNGNYDPFQCVGQACFCIDSRNLTITSDILPITDVGNLPCFKADIHSTNYFRHCENERNKVQALDYSYGRKSVSLLGVSRPDCSPDGFYTPVRQTETTLFCADPYGMKLENFEIPKDHPRAEEMNCNCARTRYWLTDHNLAKPVCCKNGNFRPYQSRGGVTFCVDSSGNQVGQEVQANSEGTLDCTDHDPHC